MRNQIHKYLIGDILQLSLSYDRLIVIFQSKSFIYVIPTKSFINFEIKVLLKKKLGDKIYMRLFPNY